MTRSRSSASLNGRALLCRVAGALAVAVERDGMATTAERLGVPAWRLRAWCEGGITRGWAQWIASRLSKLPRVRLVLPPYVSAPGFLDWGRALVAAQLRGDVELLAELEAELAALVNA